MTARGLTPSLLLQLLVVAGAAGARWRGQGTTPHLQSIILGRCAEYDALVNPDPRGRNCTAIWEAFKVVLVKDPCSVLPSDYDRFIDLSRHSIPRDKSLFWENNHLLVTSYSENGLRFLPLCSVLYGRIGDFLSWCRQENASGLDYQSCPTSEDCENNAVDSFWKRASMQYARESSGVISVMLNGSEPSGAYPVKGESCGEGTVKILEERLKKMGFQYSCINDHLPVKLLKCVDHSTHPDCVLNSAAASREIPPLWAEHGASHIVPFLVALASAVHM
ncbi:ADP-ribosyl cyclase/cyclic ADP-ribose hydrolase 2 isoform X2 [Mustela putorius furo]|uniref:ADP-ribosyl cyclase/cyclic ADP-ribose hydrolase n=1 Tax=Mustela putorius furo TaxID=9669 RepID=A0A8U0UXA5_MUSPF|nr:ADP-ribosyl cyclase/cyclic ADP-ribose hydrolase 2 isoform X2 [Mustela putorius furo]